MSTNQKKKIDIINLIDYSLMSNSQQKRNAFLRFGYLLQMSGIIQALAFLK